MKTKSAGGIKARKGGSEENPPKTKRHESRRGDPKKIPQDEKRGSEENPLSREDMAPGKNKRQVQKPRQAPEKRMKARRNHSGTSGTSRRPRMKKRCKCPYATTLRHREGAELPEGRQREGSPAQPEGRACNGGSEENPPSRRSPKKTPQGRRKEPERDPKKIPASPQERKEFPSKSETGGSEENPPKKKMSHENPEAQVAQVKASGGSEENPPRAKENGGIRRKSLQVASPGKKSLVGGLTAAPNQKSPEAPERHGRNRLVRGRDGDDRNQGRRTSCRRRVPVCYYATTPRRAPGHPRVDAMRPKNERMHMPGAQTVKSEKGNAPGDASRRKPTAKTQAVDAG